MRLRGFWRRDAAAVPAKTAAPTADALVRRYREAVFAYAARRVAGFAEAEDVTAETFAAALAFLHRCPATPAEVGDGPDPVRAWLLGIARRKVAAVCRKRARRRETPLDVSAPDAPNARPEPSLLRGEASEAIRRIVDGLKPDQREVLLLKYVEELSLMEIGQVLGRSPQAVSSLLQRARAAAFQRGQDYFGSNAGETKNTP